VSDRRRFAVGFLVALAGFTYLTFLANYWPGSGADPGLFGYAPNVLLAALLGCGVAAATDRRVADRRQAVRIAWYPALAAAASLPLYLVVLARGDPVGVYWTYDLVGGGLVGVCQEIRRW
jgi:hypothetical protein